MLSPFQTIFSTIFQEGIITKTPHHLQTDPEVCVEKKKSQLPEKKVSEDLLETKTKTI